MLSQLKPKSLSSRILLLLILAFLLIVLMAHWVIQTQAKPKIIAMTSEAVEETGNEIINGIIADFHEIDGMAKASSAMVGTLPKEDILFEQTFGNIMRQADEKIVSGGIWFDPNMYEFNVERKAFAWQRNKSGEMSLNYNFDNEAQTLNPYYQDWWYTPAAFAEHDNCVWSRAYVKADSNTPMITCAKSMHGNSKDAFKGVVSFDIVLDNIDQMMTGWQQKIGADDGTKGYVFLLDLDNRFLSFPDKSLITKITESNPQGEVITATELAAQYPSFNTIADSVEQLNSDLINQAIAEDQSRYEWVAGTIHRKTNHNKISREESNLLSALLLLNKDRSYDLIDSHLTATVAVNNDFLLNQDATAFVFSMPFTHWKMVVVKPNNAMTMLANKLSEQLVLFMILGFIPILIIVAFAFSKFFTQPLKRMAATLEHMGELIQQKKYHQLIDHQLPDSDIKEVGVISAKTNQLVKRVIENEGALADINLHLENKIEERTSELQKAMDTLKASQVQLVRSEKMASLGQMVAGVAHEVNTPLGYVRSNIEMVGGTLYRFDELIELTQHLIDTLKDPTATQEDINTAIAQTDDCCKDIIADEVSHDLHEIVKDGLFGVDQISELVISLRDFSRIDESKIKAVDINECINSSLTMAKNNLKSLTVHKKLGELDPILCNPSQINQVLLNLFNNAAQAMPSDRVGELTVASSMQQDDIVIEVSDNGIGMPDDIKAKIFEPFFTTKKAGEGTGLGLAISSQIIEQHGGTLMVESAYNVGTTFKIFLPVNPTKNHSESNSGSIFTE